MPLVQVPGRWVLERLVQCVSLLGVRRGLDNAVCLRLDGGEDHYARLPARILYLPLKINSLQSEYDTASTILAMFQNFPLFL